jgi:hypothetical protein
VFVKADIGTTKLLKVTLPATLQKVFLTKNNVPVSTRFQLRVLTTRLGKKYTSKKNSPVVSAPRPPKPPQSAADGDCNGDGIKNSATTDDDGDLLSDTLEAQINTDACKVDTDGDGVQDGFEYRSALDLNTGESQQAIGNLFYPAKLPYANPLYAGDANTDFDGDTLTLSEEQALWLFTVNDTHTAPYSLEQLSYSDGKQSSRDGYPSDDERDEDADGLSNYDEWHGRMLSSYWSSCYKDETPFHITYAGTSAVDADSDGDWILDGADDQDHDDIPNVAELSRIVASGGIDHSTGVDCKLDPAAPPALAASVDGRVNPYNPCLPDLHSRTCPVAGNAETGSPFDGVTTWRPLN